MNINMNIMNMYKLLCNYEEELRKNQREKALALAKTGAMIRLAYQYLAMNPSLATPASWSFEASNPPEHCMLFERGEPLPIYPYPLPYIWRKVDLSDRTQSDWYYQGGDDEDRKRKEINLEREIAFEKILKKIWPEVERMYWEEVCQKEMRKEQQRVEKQKKIVRSEELGKWEQERAEVRGMPPRKLKWWQRLFLVV